MTSATTATTVPRNPPSRLVWLLAGVLGTASLAAGASLFSRSRDAAPPVATAVAAASPTPTATPAPAAAVTTPAKADTSPAQTPSAAKVAAPGSATSPKAAAATTPGAPATAAVAAPVCRNCGIVESVRAVTHKGEGSGIGAVAGGVLGAAVGNQMGKGDGRKAMTVLGALGGGLAGHEVEKRSKSTTVHEVQVRMDDGTLRTVQQAQAPRPGARVRVEGQTLKVLAAEPAAQG